MTTVDDALLVAIGLAAGALLTLLGFLAGRGSARQAAKRRPSGREADARNRALRTFLQGLAIDVALAAAMLLNELTAGDGPLDLRLVGASLLRTVAQTAAAYVMRRFLDASRIPTPRPPRDPGAPAEAVA